MDRVELLKKLTAKQKKFAETFVNNGYNATQAYLEAYNCNYSCANTEGCRLARKPYVHEYITQLQQEAFEASCINAERVALKLAEIAFSDKKDEVYNTSAKLKALDLLQKQLNLQHQKIEANVQQELEINITE